MKNIITIIALLLVQAVLMSLMAKEKLAGVVISSDSQPLEYVNVSILKKDSTFYAGTITNDAGVFTFNDVPENDYILHVAGLGYEKKYLDLKNNTTDLDLGKITLKAGDIALNDVTVTSNATIQKADRRLVMPTAGQLKSSTNGVSLLYNMQLPRIAVNPLENKISMTGAGKVQLRINGIEVSVDEIATIPPSDVIRVEYHENPGMRYGGADAVIDIIVRRRETGGNVNADLVNALSDIGWAEDRLSAKVNHKKSEFSANIYYNMRDVEWTRENIETFYLPNDEVLKRVETGAPTKFKGKNADFSLNYNIQEADKYLFNARFRNRNYNMPNGDSDRNGTISTGSNPDPLYIYDHSTSKSNTPSLDLYYQQNLKNKQMLIFNIVGTYIDSKNTRLYQETRNDILSTDIFSDIEGDKYSLITEGIYEKQFHASKFTSGIKHTQSYTKNEYMGNVKTSVGLNNAETYAYGEYQFQKKKFNYTFGVGIIRYYNSQGDRNDTRYIVRPDVKVAYNINEKTYIRYNGFISGIAPDLGDLNNVVQQIDSLQIRKGNPDLRVARYFMNTLAVGYNQKYIGLDLSMRYSYDDDPIMEQTTFESGTFVRSKVNQLYNHRFSGYLTVTVRPYKEYVTLRLSPGVNRFLSYGRNYSHAHTNWFCNVDLSANYKNFILYYSHFNRQNNLWGETISRGERGDIIGVGYNKPKWSLMAGLLLPLSSNYSQDTRNMSALAPNYSRAFSSDLTNIFLTKFTLNLDFGRKSKRVDKRLNNEDSNSGMMKSGK